MKETLKLENISVIVDGKKILNDISFSIKKGEVLAIMGPNGAGKSSITKTIMSHPKYNISSGKIFLNNEDITKLSTDEKVKKGLYLVFQSPIEIPGVTLSNFLKTSYKLVSKEKFNSISFSKLLSEKMKMLKIDDNFKSRFLNVNFSGGEKKKVEMLDLLLLEPDFIMLDELDSGLDVDALKIISTVINKLRNKKKIGLIIITHYDKILNYIKPDKAIILKEGKVIDEGDGSLAFEIEKKGFN